MTSMLLSNEEKKIIRTELHDFINKNCIFRCHPLVSYYENCEPGKLYNSYPSKNKPTYQFYSRRLTHNGKMLLYLVALFMDDLVKKINAGEESENVQFAGLETSSIPIMIGMQQYAASHKIFLNTFSIRKERKNYGLFNFVDGIPSDGPVIIVDDVLNSGGTVSRCLDLCEYELDLKPANNVYTIIKFKPEVNFLKYKDKDLNLFSPFSLSEFDVNYNPDLYWFPKDCDKSYNKRPDYK